MEATYEGSRQQEVQRYVRILGFVDELGYLWCVNCRDFTAYDRGYVWADQTAHVAEPCDGCGRTLLAVETSRVLA